MIETRHVFVSHSSQDKEGIVRQILEALDEKRLSYWLDNEQIEEGSFISERISNGLLYTECFLVVLTKHSMASGWVERELGAAFSLERKNANYRIIAVMEDAHIQKEAQEKYALELGSRNNILWDATTGPETIASAVEKALQQETPTDVNDSLWDLYYKGTGTSLETPDVGKLHRSLQVLAEEYLQSQEGKPAKVYHDFIENDELERSMYRYLAETNARPTNSFHSKAGTDVEIASAFLHLFRRQRKLHLLQDPLEDSKKDKVTLPELRLSLLSSALIVLQGYFYFEEDEGKLHIPPGSVRVGTDVFQQCVQALLAYQEARQKRFTYQLQQKLQRVSQSLDEVFSFVGTLLRSLSVALPFLLLLLLSVGLPFLAFPFEWFNRMTGNFLSSPLTFFSGFSIALPLFTLQWMLMLAFAWLFWVYRYRQREEGGIRFFNRSNKEIFGWTYPIPVPVFWLMTLLTLPTLAIVRSKATTASEATLGENLAWCLGLGLGFLGASILLRLPLALMALLQAYQHEGQVSSKRPFPTRLFTTLQENKKPFREPNGFEYRIFRFIDKGNWLSRLLNKIRQSVSTLGFHFFGYSPFLFYTLHQQRSAQESHPKAQKQNPKSKKTNTSTKSSKTKTKKQRGKQRQQSSVEKGRTEAEETSTETTISTSMEEPASNRVKVTYVLQDEHYFALIMLMYNLLLFFGVYLFYNVWGSETWKTLFSSQEDMTFLSKTPAVAFFYGWLTLIVWATAMFWYYFRYIRLGIALLVLALGVLLQWMSLQPFVESSIGGRSRTYTMHPAPTQPNKRAIPPLHIPDILKPLEKVSLQKGGKGATLIVVNIGGGGLYSAVWSLMVLKKLTHTYKYFAKELRLISGVSAGSVGAAFYLKALQACGSQIQKKNNKRCLGEQSCETTCWKRAVQMLQQSKLPSIAFGLMYTGFRARLLPFFTNDIKDSGTLLEHQFKFDAARIRKKKRPSDDLLPRWRKHIKEGTVPAFLFLTTVLETGEPIALTPISTFQKDPVQDKGLPCLRRPLHPHAYRFHTMRTLPEFLCEQECNQQQEDKVCKPCVRQLAISLWTAARLSASFGWVTPFPIARWKEEKLTPPKRFARSKNRMLHLADGGIASNFGVFAGIQLLESVLQRTIGCGKEHPTLKKQMEIRKKLPFKRVAWIEIRIRGDRPDNKGAIVKKENSSSNESTTPPPSGHEPGTYPFVMNQSDRSTLLRFFGMIGRAIDSLLVNKRLSNDLLLLQYKRQFKAFGIPMKTFTFLPAQQGYLSWKLGKKEIGTLKNSWNKSIYNRNDLELSAFRNFALGQEERNSGQHSSPTSQPINQ